MSAESDTVKKAELAQPDKAELPHGHGTAPLITEAVAINEHCVGDRWYVQDQDQLARIIAIVALGQAAYAAHIIRELLPAAAPYSDSDLCHEAKIKLSVQDDGKKPRVGYPRWQRDGFMFEVISWVAARQAHGENVLLKDPHISATSQGLDGLMIQLSADKSKVVRTTVFEDKCTDNPRETFLQKVLPSFLERHQNKRGAELVATASVLLRMAGIKESEAAQIAAGTLNRGQRRYRAAFALTQGVDNQPERQRLFQGYDVLKGLSPSQRIGAGFVVDGNLREWFDSLAIGAVAYIDGLDVSGA